MSVIVGGGSGFVGRHIVKQLITQGYKPIIVSRQAKGNDTLSWKQIEQQGLPADTCAVINVAGELILQFTKKWNTSFQQEIWNSRVQTTTLLANAVQKLKQVQVDSKNNNHQHHHQNKIPFICTSAIGIYPNEPNVEYNEHSHAAGHGHYLSELCLAIEQAAQQAKDVARVCAVRPGIVYGQDGGAFAQMKLPFWFGLGGTLGNGSQYVPWIHVEDLAALYIHLIKTPSAEGAFNGVAPQHATNADFTREIGKAMNRPTIFPVPGFVFRTLLDPVRAEMLLGTQKVVPERTLKSGFQFRYPTMQDCCQALVR